jgi:type I restriction enzyme M protein
MLAHMKPPDEGGSRVAIIMNGSPLFTGDAGSGESEIRRWILENDWLEALIALPEQLFYNTGIATYVWVLTNRKASDRKGLVQLVDATSFWAPMRKSLGDKRREIPPDRSREILALHRAFAEEEHVKIFPTTHFGFRKIAVERPLWLNFQATPERLARLEEETAFRNLAVSRKKPGKERAKEEAEGRKLQETIRRLLATLPPTVFKDRGAFLAELTQAEKRAGVKLTVALRKAILSALSERDETAEICRDDEGHPEADPNLRDTENVPLAESIETYFEREVRPYVPDAWINTATRDLKDGKVGRVGYEINFNRYFYRYTPPRRSRRSRPTSRRSRRTSCGVSATWPGRDDSLAGLQTPASRRVAWRRGRSHPHQAIGDRSTGAVHRKGQRGASSPWTLDRRGS